MLKSTMMKHHTKIIALLVLFGFCFWNLSCKKDISGPSAVQVDSTSHNFTISRIDPLGELFSFAFGVDIVNENNIWVSGIFTEKDSANQIVYNKNLAHWNGTNWEKIGVQIQGFGNPPVISIQELGRVRVFSDSSIFALSRNDSYAWFRNKEKWDSHTVPLDAGPVSTFWARSPGEIYLVGDYGTITMANPIGFYKVHFGVSNPSFTDVWGDERAVYAVGGGASDSEQVFVTGDQAGWRIVDKYNYRTVSPNENFFLGAMQSVYRASSSSKLWLLGGWINWKVYEILSLEPFSSKLAFELPPDIPAFMIRGTADNDLYVISQLNGVFYHYNGVSWARFDPHLDGFHVFHFAVKGDTWVVVGAGSNGGVGTAIAVVGKHI